MRTVLLAVWAALQMLAPAFAAGTVLVDSTSTVRYRANVVDPGVDGVWPASAFNDSGWASGLQGLGYDSAPGSSLPWVASPVPVGTFSLYVRIPFTVTDATGIDNLFLGVDYDDGVVAWINGVEVYRSPEVPAGPLAWNTPAAAHECGNGSTPYYTYADITTTALAALHNGTNVLAVGAWNTGPASTDLALATTLFANAGPTVVRGPYLQSGTPQSVIVRWRTDLPTSSRVAYGSAPGSLTGSATEATLVTDHIVRLSGLAPDTKYHYAVGSTTELLAGGDASHYFWTSPPTGTRKPTRVWILGDSGKGNADARAVRDAYYAFTGTRNTDLWLMLGDNAYEDGTDGDYQRAVFDMYPGMLRRSVLWPTLGNHDALQLPVRHSTAPYFDMLHAADRRARPAACASGTEAYYSFDYANIHFVVLDSQASNRLPLAPMLDLARATTWPTRPQEWIIAFWHHPPYSKGVHDSDTEIELVADAAERRADPRGATAWTWC